MPRDTARDGILAWGRSVGLPVTAAYLDRLDPFWDLLLRWSRRVDLTGFRDRDAAIDGLLAPSLALAATGAIGGPGPVLDIGSGAGIPGIPLALLRPDMEFHLVEPRARRALFLREAISALSLANAHALRDRVEALAPATPYGAAISRALDPLPLLPAVGRLLAPGAAWWVQSPPLAAPLPEGWEATTRAIRDATGREISFVRLSPRFSLADRGVEKVP